MFAKTQLFSKETLEVLSYFSQEYPLQYYLPLAAMGLVGCFYLLRRAPVRQLLETRQRRFVWWALVALLVIVAILSVENYRATDYHRFDTYLNAYEFYHYYIGTKYAREVGYTDMYAATLIADSETGMKWRHERGTIRDLAEGRHVNHKQFLERAEEYKANFTPERWEEFKKDIVWFKGRLVQGRWNGILRDKGYNGTPVWSMLVGGLLSNRISTDSEAGMMFLALLDPLLILITFALVVWAFGLRTALLLIVMLGTHYMMKWWHMKGAYLRTDWAMCLVMSACLIRKQRFGVAGALTGYAILSRIFPAVLLFGIGAKLFWNIIELTMDQARKLYARLQFDKRPFEVRLLLFLTVFVFAVLLVWRARALLSGVIVPWLAQDSKTPAAFFSQLISTSDGYSPFLQVISLLIFLCIGVFLTGLTLWGLWHKRLERRYFYFLVSASVTVVSLTAVSFVYWHGTDYWAQYREKIGKHSEDISTWRVGYKYIFMADFGDDFSYFEKPLQDWQPRVRSALYNDRQVEWWQMQLWILALTLFACLGVKDYRAFILGFVPLFFLVSPTYYYYIMLLFPLLFFAPRIEHGRYALGLCLMYATGMAGFWFYDMWRQNYATYYWLSVLIMVMVFYMLLLAYTENFLFVAEQRALRRKALAEEPVSDPSAV